MTVHRAIRRAASSAAILVVAGLAACSVAPQRDPAASYDLGPPAAREARPAIPAVLLVPDVSSPAWLDGNGIVYRLGYDNNARPQAYAGSRWVSPPAALFTQ